MNDLFIEHLSTCLAPYASCSCGADRKRTEADARAQIRRPIRTSPVWPPTGLEGFDYISAREGYEAGDTCGYGRTPDEATVDLLVKEEAEEARP